MYGKVRTGSHDEARSRAVLEDLTEQNLVLPLRVAARGVDVANALIEGRRHQADAVARAHADHGELQPGPPERTDDRSPEPRFAPTWRLRARTARQHGCARNPSAPRFDEVSSSGAAVTGHGRTSVNLFCRAKTRCPHCTRARITMGAIMGATFTIAPLLPCDEHGCHVYHYTIAVP